MALRVLIVAVLVIMSLLFVHFIWKWIDRSDMLEKFFSSMLGKKDSAKDIICGDRESRAKVLEAERERLRRAEELDREAESLRSYRTKSKRGGRTPDPS